MSNKVTTSKDVFPSSRDQAQLTVQEKAKLDQNKQRITNKKQQAKAVNDAAHTLTHIRAQQTHSPAPKVGSFNFMDEYGHFKAGVAYLVPQFVADALIESGNAISLEIANQNHMAKPRREWTAPESEQVVEDAPEATVSTATEPAAQ